jgi:hypothetical protein
MVTWPANMRESARAFSSRQLELREKLRWVPLRSKRRRKLEAELADLVQSKLTAEAKHEAPVDPADDEPQLPWYDR